MRIAAARMPMTIINKIPSRHISRRLRRDQKGIEARLIAGLRGRSQAQLVAFGIAAGLLFRS